MIKINEDDLNILVTACDFVIYNDVVTNDLSIHEAYNKNKDLIVSLFEQFLLDQLKLNGGNYETV